MGTLINIYQEWSLIWPLPSLVVVYCEHFYYLFIILFIHLVWLHWLFIAVGGLPLVVSRGYSLSQCAGFPLGWPLLLQSMSPRCASFSSYGTWASLSHSVWDLPWPGPEPESRPVAGGLLTTKPPGKSLTSSILKGEGDVSGPHKLLGTGILRTLFLQLHL